MRRLERLGSAAAAEGGALFWGFEEAGVEEGVSLALSVS